MYYGVHLSQMSPQSLSRLSHYEIACRSFEVVPDLFVFRAFYRLTMAGDWYTFEKRRQMPSLCTRTPPHVRSWKTNFFYVDDRCVPAEMKWRKRENIVHDDPPLKKQVDSNLYRRIKESPYPINEMPEIVLVVARISRNWPYPDKWPIMLFRGEG
jgi:hypothetical protein